MDRVAWVLRDEAQTRETGSVAVLVNPGPLSTSASMAALASTRSALVDGTVRGHGFAVVPGASGSCSTSLVAS